MIGSTPIEVGISSAALGIVGVVSAFGLFYLGERVFHLDRAIRPAGILWGSVGTDDALPARVKG